MASDLISREALLAEYDRVHVGEPGGARKLMEEAPAVERKAKLLKNVCIKKKACQGYKMREGYYMQPYTCSHCLKSIPEDSEYCMYCGYELVKEKDND